MIRDVRSMTPMVSVIIPTYNRGSLVTGAIDSVLEQTFTDLELIVIDDGSTDNTVQRLGSYLDRIRYFHQANLGASAAQNAGLREARGQWVAILASDDTWHPTKLERQLEAIARLGTGFGACFTDCRFVGNPSMKATAFEESGFKPDQAFGPLRNPLQYVWEATYGLYVQSLLASRSLVMDVGGFDEGLKYSEDRDLIFKLSFRTEFCYVAAPLVDIDRTESIARLTTPSPDWDHEAFLCNELSLRKMLEFPELKDGDIRQRIEEELLLFYYNHAAQGLRNLDLGVVREGVQRIHREGLSYPRIWQNLLVRAAKKLLREIRR
jgi:glycosyltransferase involved in cell wall biosynthesis